jgi:hypothetical protein
VFGVVVGEAGGVGEVEPGGLVAAGGELGGGDAGVVLGVAEVGQGDRELGLVAGRVESGQGAVDRDGFLVVGDGVGVVGADGQQLAEVAPAAGGVGQGLAVFGVVVGEAGGVGEVEPGGLVAAGGELGGGDAGVVLGVAEVGCRRTGSRVGRGTT